VTGRLHALFRFQVLNVLLNLPVLFIMVHLWGSMGAAYSLVLFSATLLAFFAVQARVAFARAEREQGRA
jgi:O-antigen/teichoic acid export membrane protein